MSRCFRCVEPLLLANDFNETVFDWSSLQEYEVEIQERFDKYSAQKPLISNPFLCIYVKLLHPVI